ncbi:MAG TPA: hypothetical protein VFP50_12970 [Anaeromyxobacteraceae bacterium]|nr:hypothetical protein [Anaeromyxobacteraceae bacterium]
MIQDPAGLLQRIAELEPLCADPAIRKAVERGDPFKVYRALFWAKLLRRLPEHRRTIDALLASRRAFARPLAGKPWLGTFNSVGATLLGKAEPEPDGSHIATHCVVVLFAVPLFPLGAYVVAGGGRTGLSSSWTLFARAPLSLGAWLWSRGVALAAAVAVAGGALGAFHASRHHDLHVLNGFGRPLLVQVGPAALTVPAGQRAVINLPVGRHEARARAEGGGELEPLQLDVAAGGDLLVWNVAGAAPLVRTEVPYYKEKPPADEEPARKIHCGDEVVRIPKVDDAFKDSPHQVSMSEGQKRVVRRHVDVAREQGMDGADLCAFVLLDGGRDRDAARIHEAKGRLGGWSAPDALQAIAFATAADPAEGVRVARLALAARPDDTKVERGYQNAMLAAGQEAELVAEYRRRAQAAPGSARAQYLLLRLLRGPEQAALGEQLVARFPSDPDLLRIVTAIRTRTGDFAGADATWRALRSAAPADALDVLPEEAVALVALGKRADALSLLEKTFDAPGERRDQLEPAVLFARVAALDGAPQPDKLVRRLEKDSPDQLLRARAGLPVEAGSPTRLVKLLAAVGRDPAAALASAAALTVPEVALLDRGTWGLLFGEAVRTGAGAAAKALSRYGPIVGAELLAFQRFVKGEAAALPELDLDLRAAAQLVRSRNASLPAAERERLVAGARHDDWLAGNVTRAIAAWAPPAAAP